jgi:hypothetical protein
MKHLKSYKLFESYEPWAGDASEIIRDYKSEFTDLGFDVSSTEVTTYQINDDKIITCLYFEVSTPLDTIELVSECYDTLTDLQSHLEKELGLDLSLEMYEDLPLIALDDANEVYGATEWELLQIYIHKPFDRSKVEDGDDEDEDDW